ncbi:MAG: hypothetical protein Q8R07_03595 [Candidatus Uhrbacteria bacterium]|nr:hypothetical protein [Candidatus Uhrbacteria bacterium]
MRYITRKTNTIVSLGLILAMLAIFAGPFSEIALAAALTAKSDAMTSLKVSTLSNHDIQFTSPTGVASGQTIIITFPSDFSIPAALDFEDMDVLDDTVNVVLAAAPSGATWGAVRTSATVITLTNGTTVVAAGSVIRIKIGTNAVSVVTGIEKITNPTTNGSKTISMSGTFGDTGDIIVSILTDDQVAVSGTVAESMTFTLGATSVALGTLSSAAVTSGSHTVTLATNAASGLTLSYSGTTLTSGGNTITAMSTAAASSVGTEQFGINAKDNATPNVGLECSGTAPIAAAATGYSTADSYKFVTGETIISSASGINSTSCTISYIANILGSTEAGSYTTTLTYNATANF